MYLRENRDPNLPAPEEIAAYKDGMVWRRFVAKYRSSSTALQVCYVCGHERVALHHRTYERMGKERFEDIVPLCTTHHMETHRLVDQGKASLWDAHLKLPRLAYPIGNQRRDHTAANWRTAKPGKHPKPEVRYVTPDEAKAMVQAARERKNTTSSVRSQA